MLSFRKLLLDAPRLRYMFRSKHAHSSLLRTGLATLAAFSFSCPSTNDTQTRRTRSTGMSDLKTANRQWMESVYTFNWWSTGSLVSAGNAMRQNGQATPAQLWALVTLTETTDFVTEASCRWNDWYPSAIYSQLQGSFVSTDFHCGATFQFSFAGRHFCRRWPTNVGCTAKPLFRLFVLIFEPPSTYPAITNNNNLASDDGDCDMIMWVVV